MFRDRFGRNKDRDPFDSDAIWESKDEIGKMLEARKGNNHRNALFSPQDNFFSDGPNRRACEGELYFDSRDNTIYRGNSDGSWTKATQLSEVVVQNLIGTLVKSDGIRVFGYGSDPIAGSGNLGNDRGYGSINSPGTDFNTAFDLGYLLGKLFPNSSMMYPWLLEFELRLKYGTPKRLEPVSVNATSSDPEMILMSLYHYRATDPFGVNLSVIQERKLRDTIVDQSQIDKINELNNTSRQKAEQERDIKNDEFLKKLEYYKEIKK